MRQGYAESETTCLLAADRSPVFFSNFPRNPQRRFRMMGVWRRNSGAPGSPFRHQGLHEEAWCLPKFTEIRRLEAHSDIDPMNQGRIQTVREYLEEG